MKIKKVILKNFRGYRDKTVIEIDDLTVFVGKNDVGKSTILDALDIFFNEGKGVVKIDKDDLNKQAEKNGEKEIEIGIIFTELPSEIIVDATVPVTLQDEFLLNEEGDLEIYKVFKDGKLKETYILAKHPANDDFIKNLLLTPISRLKEYVEQHNLLCEDKRKASLLRKSIRNSYNNIVYENIKLPTDKEGTREIWSKLQNYLPVYALFKSDRTNTDENMEVQDPLKSAVKEVLKKEDIQTKLDGIAEEVRRIVTEIAKATLEELKKINPHVAKQLKPYIPDVTKLKWSDVFKKISIVSDDDVPLNKRGSGVRRLVLLSFFAAEAERRKREKNAVHVIYAIEEPETSQHPDHQRLLIKNFIELSQTGNTQIFLTTHSTSLTSLLPIDSLRLVYKDNNKTVVKSGKDDPNILLDIVESLGILPSYGKVVICVEGERDRNFLLNINQNIPELREIVDLTKEAISIIPMNGTQLKYWVERYYLKNTNVCEFHLYDRDEDEKYKEFIKEINKRENCEGTLTQKKEIENYIHRLLIENKFNIKMDDIKNWDEEDIPKYLSKKLNKNEKEIKYILCNELSQKMTKELLEDLGAWEEVKTWFEKIKGLFQKTTPKEHHATQT